MFRAPCRYAANHRNAQTNQTIQRKTTAASTKLSLKSIIVSWIWQNASFKYNLLSIIVDSRARVCVCVCMRFIRFGICLFGFRLTKLRFQHVFIAIAIDMCRIISKMLETVCGDMLSNSLFQARVHNLLIFWLRLCSC